jgi:hypothetical protein
MDDSRRRWMRTGPCDGGRRIPEKSQRFRQELTSGAFSLKSRTGDERTSSRVRIRTQSRQERIMERPETEIQRDDEQSSLVAKVMVSAVAAMALLVVATVLVFSSGGTIIA